MLFRLTSCSLFSHILQALKRDVSLAPDACAKHCNEFSPTDWAGNQSWVPPQSSRPELLTVNVGSTRASMSITWGRVSTDFAGISSSKINMSCSVIRKVLLEMSGVFLISLLPLTYMYIFSLIISRFGFWQCFEWSFYAVTKRALEKAHTVWHKTKPALAVLTSIHSPLCTALRCSPSRLL